MTVVMVARDLAPSGYCTATQPVLEQMGIDVSAFIGKGKEIPRGEMSIEDAVNGASIVLVGMSSKPDLSAEELLACRLAQEAGIPFALIADTWTVANGRPWFNPYKAGAKLLFVPNEEEAGKAVKAYTANTKIVVSGNPNWEKYFYPTKSWEEVRSIIGVPRDKMMVLSPGGKSAVINVLLWDKLRKAAEEARHEWQIVVSLHPGDPNGADSYQDLADYAGIKIVTSEISSTDDLLPGCDAVVESASGVGTGASICRIPTITWFSDIAKARLGGSWDPIELGLSAQATNRQSLTDLLDHVLNRDGVFSQQLERQEAVFPPPPERGSAAQAIACAIRDLIG